LTPTDHLVSKVDPGTTINSLFKGILRQYGFIRRRLDVFD